jgi:hypothetical protein
MMAKLNIKKELAKLPKYALINLICDIAMMQYPSTYQRASVIYQVLSNYAYKQTLKNDDKPLTITRLVAGTKLSEEFMRVSDLDVSEIEKQLIAAYFQADKKREAEREKVMAEVFKWKP